MEKRKFLPTLPILLLILVAGFSFFLLYNNGLKRIPEEFILMPEGNVIGCLFGFEDYRYLCLSKDSNELLETDILEGYNNLDSFTKGFYLITTSSGELQLYEYDHSSVLDEWLSELEDLDSLFIREIEDQIHLDLYNLTRLRLVENKVGLISIEDVLEEYEEYKSPPYVVMTPMHMQDLTQICDEEESCDYWSLFNNVPYSVIDSRFDSDDWVYSDVGNNWSLIKYLNMGINSVGGLYQDYPLYKQLVEEYKGYYMDTSFVADFIPFNLSNYSNLLYTSFSNENSKSHYYYLLGSFCKEPKPDCWDNKLSVLYNEYK